MSKSDADSAIFMEDSAHDVKRKLDQAHCPTQEAEEGEGKVTLTLTLALALALALALTLTLSLLTTSPPWHASIARPPPIFARHHGCHVVQPSSVRTSPLPTGRSSPQ